MKIIKFKNYVSARIPNTSEDINVGLTPQKYAVKFQVSPTYILIISNVVINIDKIMFRFFKSIIASGFRILHTWVLAATNNSEKSR